MGKATAHQRHAFIELLAYWEGRINAKDLERQFNLSRQQCSAYINAYKQQLPNNLVYDGSHKNYKPSVGFKRHYISADAGAYLNWLHTGHWPEHTATVSPCTAALEIPARQVSPDIMRGLVIAVRQQRRIDVEYASLSNPDSIGRILSPHCFVRTGLRWHLRAWCEKSRAYRDFVFSRFRGTPELLDKATFLANGDMAWNTQVTVLLQPDPRLNPEKRAVLENDYQMVNGQLAITTRGCLVQYLLRELQVNTKVLDGTPEAQQLVCVNLVDIKEWLFGGNNL